MIRYRPSLTQKRVVEAGRFGRRPDVVITTIRRSGHARTGEDEALGKEDRGPRGRDADQRGSGCFTHGHRKPRRSRNGHDEGVNYPKGLLRWCDERGADKVLNVLRGLRKHYEEDRYRPSVLLKQMATSGQKFHA